MKVGDTVWVLTQYTFEPFPRRVVYLGPIYGQLDDGWQFHIEEMRLVGAGAGGGIYTDDEQARAWLKLRRSIPWRMPPWLSVADVEELHARISGAQSSKAT
jgi:hypothetical protein